MAQTQFNGYRISLAAARVNANMTQEDVAKRLRVGKQTIVAWENGSREMKISQAKEICELYGLPADCIFFGNKIQLK